MAMRFTLLGSSSQGNCALLETEKTRVLIDAGFSGRQIQEKLARLDLDLSAIQAVFITHEHSDHSAGLRGLSRHRHLEFYANHATAQACQHGLSSPLSWRLFETGQRFAFRDLEVETVRLPHDAYDPVGFVFRQGETGSLFSPARALAWITDLGYVTERIARLVREVQGLVLEANHDPDLLQADTKRPFSVKQRILGRHGHLSNAAARDFLDRLDSPALEQVCLAHLSRDCNSPQHVRTAFAGSRYGETLQVADPEGPACVTLTL